MWPFDWNVVTLPLYVYGRYVKPFLISWGILPALHNINELLLTTLKTLLAGLFNKTIIVAALTLSIKFLLLIALLIFIRGGVPRYRYDFLTKIGWIKFLSLVLAVFLTSLVLTCLC